MRLSLIREANARYSSSHEPVICVFAGATSGIGASTIERLARMLEKPTFYAVGRPASRFAPQRTQLNTIDPSSKIVFLEVEFSLLSHVDDVCNQIGASEQKNLLPLLRQPPEPSILSVLNGGKEASINEDDLGLERGLNKEVAFLHVYPGWVRTDKFSRLAAAESSGFAWASVLAFVRGLASVPRGVAN
ncbi:hypothetical protein DL764_007293 [Monosporascus ibericus]|uniref:Ketoreductase (KR) domain-containing protein n=1 Tax=Monosporascus ibericus TaxID=155417 RepID=A0A4Q4T469_9PEZI|nr:hypothetical protein DL764_007293 [Monosporascus ibericus]